MFARGNGAAGAVALVNANVLNVGRKNLFYAVDASVQGLAPMYDALLQENARPARALLPL
jgi:hypothetical protein